MCYHINNGAQHISLNILFYTFFLYYNIIDLHKNIDSHNSFEHILCCINDFHSTTTLQTENDALMKTARKILGALLISGILILLIIYTAGVIHYSKVFLPGSYINTIDYSGCTVEEVENDIKEKLSHYTLSLLGRNGISDNIFAKDVNYHYVSDGQVAILKEEQNPFTWPFSFQTVKNSEMHVTSTFDEDSLEDVVSNLLFFSEDVIQPPVDAKICYGDMGFYIQEEEKGTTIAKKDVIDAVINALTLGDTELDLEPLYRNPEITCANEKLLSAFEKARKYSRATITYDFGDRTEVLDHTTLHEWITITDDFKVTLSKQSVIDYVNYLGYHYTTFASTREFTKHNGTTIKVKGGDYGWIIDREKEVEELYSLIKKGKSTSREPVYSQTARSRNKNDIGDTYVEVNLKKQHLWMYVDGKEVLDSDFVSGNVSRKYDTPTGIYQITYKERDATLTGQDYSSPVKYWMPFNRNIGFHDASWRKKFGGKIYKTAGSHGCINMPPKKAEKLFSYIEKGTPVVVY